MFLLVAFLMVIPFAAIVLGSLFIDDHDDESLVSVYD